MGHGGVCFYLADPYLCGRDPAHILPRGSQGAKFVVLRLDTHRAGFDGIRCPQGSESSGPTFILKAARIAENLQRRD